MTASGYQTYLAALRELNALRTDADAAVARHREATTGHSRAVDRQWQRLTEQRARLWQLADDCRLPSPDLQAPPPPPPMTGDPVVDIAAATADLDAAEEGHRRSRYLAHRAKLLPAWRADDRNGLIYGVFALLCLLVQAVVLASAAGTEQLWDLTGQFLLCVLAPFVAWGAGWLTIGVVSRPILGEESTFPDGKLPRNPRLGLVICLSTWLVSCALGNVYLNF